MNRRTAIEVTTEPAAEDLATLKSGMRRYELSRLPGLPDESEDLPVAAFIRDADGSVVAGVQANVFWNGVDVEIVWVDERFRGQGLGAAVMAKAEAFARSNGAVIAYLRTVDARGFYESLGYEVYGVLEDRPIGTVLYHMKKRLDRA